jgi:hypothetical protein
MIQTKPNKQAVEERKMANGLINVQLKTFEIKVTGGDPVKIDYKALMKGALNSVPEGGLAPADMRDRIKLMDKLEDATGTVSLSQEEVDIIYGLAKDQKFGVIHKGFVDYMEDLEKMKNGIKESGSRKI